MPRGSGGPADLTLLLFFLFPLAQKLGPVGFTFGSIVRAVKQGRVGWFGGCRWAELVGLLCFGDAELAELHT